MTHSFPLNVGLVGTGKWGLVLARNLLEMPEYNLSSVVSRSGPVPHLEEFGVRTFKCWQDAIGDASLDALVLAIPPSLNREVICEAARARLPIFVEKPLSLSVQDAMEICRVQAEYEIPVFVDHIHLFSPAFRALKALVMDKGGDILGIKSLAGRMGPFRKDQSVLWDWGAHDVAMVFDLLGTRPKSCAAHRVRQQVIGANVGEHIEFTLEFENACCASIHISNILDVPRREFIVYCKTLTAVYSASPDGNSMLVYDPLSTGEALSCKGVPMSFSPTPPLEIALREFAMSVVNWEYKTRQTELGLSVIETLASLESNL